MCHREISGVRLGVYGMQGSRDLVEARAHVSHYLARARRACLLDAGSHSALELLAPALQAISDGLGAILPAL